MLRFVFQDEVTFPFETQAHSKSKPLQSKIHHCHTFKV